MTQLLVNVAPSSEITRVTFSTGYLPAFLSTFLSAPRATAIPFCPKPLPGANPHHPQPRGGFNGGQCRGRSCGGAEAESAIFFLHD